MRRKRERTQTSERFSVFCSRVRVYVFLCVWMWNEVDIERVVREKSDMAMRLKVWGTRGIWCRCMHKSIIYIYYIFILAWNESVEQTKRQREKHRLRAWGLYGRRIWMHCSYTCCMDTFMISNITYIQMCECGEHQFFCSLHEKRKKSREAREKNACGRRRKNHFNVAGYDMGHMSHTVVGRLCLHTLNSI